MRGLLALTLFIFAATAGAQAQSVGQASYYRLSRDGSLVAAHRTLPFGTRVRVTNLGNGRAATVIVVDRGPFIRGRIIDVSTPAAEALGFRSAGLARVRIEIVAQELAWPAWRRPAGP